MLRNTFGFELFPDICFSENYNNNVLISMNLPLCQLSVSTLVSFLACTYAFWARPRNFTKF